LSFQDDPMCSMRIIKEIKTTLRNSISVSPERVSIFFKTGKGDYAQDDQFMGVTVPTLRTIAKYYKNLSLTEIKLLLESKINEERLLALIILVTQYQKASAVEQSQLYHFYLKNRRYVNNWNLVDASAHLIVGAYLWDKNREKLLSLAASKILWDRRIAIVATWYFIRQADLEWTFKLALVLKDDTHDLIHKAVGWMLRETGKRDQSQLIKFLDNYATFIPRTTLRYAIEKFSKEQRAYYLSIR